MQCVPLLCAGGTWRSEAFGQAVISSWCAFGQLLSQPHDSCFLEGDYLGTCLPLFWRKKWEGAVIMFRLMVSGSHTSCSIVYLHLTHMRINSVCLCLFNPCKDVDLRPADEDASHLRGDGYFEEIPASFSNIFDDVRPYFSSGTLVNIRPVCLMESSADCSAVSYRQ